MSPRAEGPWRCRHTGPGTYDETARRVDHPEYAVAQLLVREGHHVRSLPERAGSGKTSDFVACGVMVEVKAFQSLSERHGRPPSAEGVVNKLVTASEQGAVGVVWAGASGLSAASARAGYVMYCLHAVGHGLGRLRSVRVVGEGFDISFDPVADVRAAWQARAGRGQGHPAARAGQAAGAGRRPRPAARVGADQGGRQPPSARRAEPRVGPRLHGARP